MSYPIPKKITKYTFAQYMQMEETSTERHDFYYGEVFAMAGARVPHHQICQNINASLLQAFKPKGCFVSLEGVRLELVSENFYVYPDVFLTCDDKDKKNDLYKKHPSIIFEVLPEFTMAYDAQVKLTYHKKIESLNYYVLVSQEEIKVQVYSRIDNSQIWQYQTYEIMEEIIDFDRLGFALPVETIYDGIGFDEENLETAFL